MPFDPNFPPFNSEMISAEYRAQFNALKALIDAQQAQLDAQAAQITALQIALAGTAQNPNVGTLSLALSEPPLRAEVQAFLDHVNALVNQLTRV